MGDRRMGLTKKGKILLTSLGVLLAIASIVAFAVSIEKKHQLQLPPEKSGLERLVDIKDSLTRARDKMALLIDSTLESSERSKRDTGMITHLLKSVNHLSKSLSDFAEVLNQTGFSHILSRYEKDLKSFTRILKNIQANNGTLDQEGLEQIKIIEQLFFEDETDLMNVDIITSEEAESAQTIMKPSSRQRTSPKLSVLM